MKNFKCLYINIYSSDNQFVYQQPRSGSETPKPVLASYNKLKPDVAPGGKPQPAGPPSPATEKAEKAAAETAAKGKSVIKKRQTSDQLALIPEFGEFDVGKLDKRSIDGMSKQQQKDTFRKSEGGGTYVINFGGRGTVAERMIGLRHLFDEKTPFLVVQDKMGVILSFAEYRNGNFYDAKTDRRVRIYNGYKILVPPPEDLARFKQMAKKEREALAKVKKEFEEYIIGRYVNPKVNWLREEAVILADTLYKLKKYSKKEEWEKDLDYINKVAQFWIDKEKEFKDKNQTVTALFLSKEYQKANKPKAAPAAPATSAEREALAEVKKEAEKEKTPEKKLYAYIDKLKKYKITQPQRSIIAKAMFKFKKDFDIDNNNDKKLFNNVLETYMLNKDLSVDHLVTLADNWNRGIIYRPVADTETQEKQREVAAAPDKKEPKKPKEAPTKKDKLVAYISAESTGFWFSEAETAKLSNALFKFNKDFDVDNANHRELLHNVCKNYAQNRNLSEYQIVVLATYENMPNAFKEEFKTTLNKGRFQFNFTNEIDLKALQKIMKAYKNRRGDMTLQIVAALQGRPEDEGGGQTAVAGL